MVGYSTMDAKDKTNTTFLCIALQKPQLANKQSNIITLIGLNPKFLFQKHKKKLAFKCTFYKRAPAIYVHTRTYHVNDIGFFEIDIIR